MNTEKSYQKLISDKAVLKRRIVYKDRQIERLQDRVKELTNKLTFVDISLKTQTLFNNETEIELSDKLQYLVSLKFGVDILTRRRHRDIVYPRQLYCYWMRKNTNISLKTIGGKFGLDHSTIINAVNRIEDLMSYHKQTKLDYEDICRLMRKSQPNPEPVINPS